MRFARLIVLIALLFFGSKAFSQARPANRNYYSRLNGFGLFSEYSNDSSPMLLGVSRNRKLLDFGGSYTRRFLLSRFIDGQYMAEVRPVMLESDPITDETTVIVSPPVIGIFLDGPVAEACHPVTSTFTLIVQGITYTEKFTRTCPGRRWTYGAGFSPIGYKLNFLPRHRIQPVFTGLGGFMVARQQIPVSGASRFNFTFEFGMGLEFYRSPTNSIRAEWRYHHISNDYTANQNPGIDSGLFQATYTFGH